MSDEKITADELPDLLQDITSKLWAQWEHSLTGEGPPMQAMAVLMRSTETFIFGVAEEPGLLTEEEVDEHPFTRVAKAGIGVFDPEAIVLATDLGSGVLVSAAHVETNAQYVVLIDYERVSPTEVRVRNDRAPSHDLVQLAAGALLEAVEEAAEMRPEFASAERYAIAEFMANEEDMLAAKYVAMLDSFDEFLAPSPTGFCFLQAMRRGDKFNKTLTDFEPKYGSSAVQLIEEI